MYLNAASSNGLGSLGRMYGKSVQDLIDNYSKVMNTMMDSTGRLSPDGAQNARDLLKKANASLVNDVILKTDDIADDEAMKRLSAIRKDMYGVETIFQKEQVAIEALPPMPTVAGTAVISVADAKELVSQFPRALEVHASLIERYPKVRSALQLVGAMPFMGPWATAMTADLDTRMKWLSDNVVTANEYFKQFPNFIAASQKRAVPGAEATVSMDRPTYDLMRFWVARAFSMDELLKRMAGTALKQPVTLTVRLPLIGEVPRTTAIVAGVGAVGLVGTGLYLLLRAAPRRKTSYVPAPAMAGSRRRRKRRA